jgi:transaldolase/transaldolase/glucose-6-phosphate isomerase
MTKLHELHQEGQSIWYDFIRRDMLTGQGLATLVDEGVRGVTSNPSIFENAIGGTDLYDEQLSTLDTTDSQAAFEALAIADIKNAADILAGVYSESNGADGYVSLEVSPRLARDTDGTIADARRLWAQVDRPNLMVKVPATPAGIPAIEQLTADGLNINATLMFSLADYEAVATAYVHGTLRADQPTRLASVASFFVSRVDSATDAALDAIGTPETLAARGKAAIANAKLAYRRYEEIFGGDQFEQQASTGVRPQRVLWASTSAKNPSYRDVMYVEELIGPNTVNTAPPNTIEAFLDHGIIKAASLLKDVDEANDFIASLGDIGVDFDGITSQLQIDGVASFAAAFESLLTTISTKLT